MRSIIIASSFGLFLTLAVIGVLSVSPMLDSPSADQKISYVLDWVLPQKVPQTEPIAQSTVATNPKVLGLQTQSTAISAGTIYGLINGTRRDSKQSLLRVNPTLEKIALAINAGRNNPLNSDQQDEATVLQKFGYTPASFTVLEAQSIESDWEALQAWEQNPREQLLLHSNSFSEMGLAILCTSQKTHDCSALLLLATPR